MPFSEAGKPRQNRGVEKDGPLGIEMTAMFEISRLTAREEDVVEIRTISDRRQRGVAEH